MISRLAAALLATFAIFSTGAAMAADPVYTPRFSNLAVDGYDPVAYFEQGEPIKGAKQFTLEHNGAEWRFASQENLNAFSADPAAYAPQFGGYCAWAVSQGYTARGNPNNWSIVDGKLYLNYNDQVQADWKQDIPGFIALAEANWPGLLN